jgi:hypothetical protein
MSPFIRPSGGLLDQGKASVLRGRQGCWEKADEPGVQAIHAWLFPGSARRTSRESCSLATRPNTSNCRPGRSVRRWRIRACVSLRRAALLGSCTRRALLPQGPSRLSNSQPQANELLVLPDLSGLPTGLDGAELRRRAEPRGGAFEQLLAQRARAVGGYLVGSDPEREGRPWLVRPGRSWAATEPPTSRLPSGPGPAVGGERWPLHRLLHGRRHLQPGAGGVHPHAHGSCRLLDQGSAGWPPRCTCTGGLSWNLKMRGFNRWRKWRSSAPARL